MTCRRAAFAAGISREVLGNDDDLGCRARPCPSRRAGGCRCDRSDGNVSWASGGAVARQSGRHAVSQIRQRRHNHRSPWWPRWRWISWRRWWRFSRRRWFRGGGFRAAPIYRGGGYRAARVYRPAPAFRYGGGYRVHRYAYHRPHYRRHYVPRRHFYRPPYVPYYTYPRCTFPYRYICRTVWTYYGPRRVCRCRLPVRRYYGGYGW